MLKQKKNLKLVSNNDVTVSYFKNYYTAVDFVMNAYKDRIPNPGILTRDQFAKIVGDLCESKIQCYEDDNLVCNYRVKVRK
jgi:hypothetical protein